MGATERAGGRHAEIVALDEISRAQESAQGATMYVTLEPCNHHGRTGPCAQAIVLAGISKVVIGVLDPDPLVAGAGLEFLEKAGVDCEVGVCKERIQDQLRPYFLHRLLGRPYVTLKLAVTSDGMIADYGGKSKWITSQEARYDTHLLRSKSDAVLVGAGTVRCDDPELTVRLGEGHEGLVQPTRVVLGKVPQGSRVLPALELSGDLRSILADLAGRGIINLLVEGGANVAQQFHEARLVDRYIIYMAPAFFGGGCPKPMFQGGSNIGINEIWRGSFVEVSRLGPDIKLVLEP